MKWIIGSVAVLVLVLISIYFMIPSPVPLANNVGFKSTSSGAYRILSQQHLWDSLTDNSFRVTQRLINTVDLASSTDSDSFYVRLFLIPVRNDSVNVTWRSDLPEKKGVLAKWHKYSTSLDIREKIEDALDAFKSYVEDDQHIYGLKIIELSTTDTLLIATKFKTTAYPSISEIYHHIGLLQQFAQSSNAKQTGYPMLNATRIDSTTYQCMVAIPIDKIIPGTQTIFFVRMVPGRFLTTEVTGGPQTIAQAHQSMQLYFQDYKRTAMAIPFEYLVSDRGAVKDTASWKTIIYGPVY